MALRTSTPSAFQCTRLGQTLACYFYWTIWTFELVESSWPIVIAVCALVNENIFPVSSSIPYFFFFFFTQGPFPQIWREWVLFCMTSFTILKSDRVCMMYSPRHLMWLFTKQILNPLRRIKIWHQIPSIKSHIINQTIFQHYCSTHNIKTNLSPQWQTKQRSLLQFFCLCQH